jgi:4-amino-4-deoxy-L-arabinose transferase-like glycosyltransferase
MTELPKSSRDLLWLLPLGAVLFLTGLGATDLWNPDEPRYAEIAREMILFGDAHHFFVPHLNGQVYTQKPPLLFWSICASATILGQLDEVAARVPTALSGLLCLPLIFGMGRRLFNRRAAWMSVLVFGTCTSVMLQARVAQIDMLLMLMVTLAMYFWIRGYLERRSGFYLLFFVATGLGTLAKGPVGLLPPMLSILVFLLVTGQKSEIRRLRLLPGLGLYLLVILIWLLPAAILGGEDYWQPIVFKQTVQRYANPWGHIRPWYYYLVTLPGNFFPWSVLLPSALMLGWRRFRDADRRAYLFALCWVVVTLVFFSLSPGKRTVYILSMYPAMALLIGAALDRLAEERLANRNWLGWPVGVLALALLIPTAAGLAAGLRPDLIADRAELRVLGASFPWLVASTLGLFLVAVIYASVAVWRRRVVSAFVALAAGCGVAGLLIVYLVRPPFDAYKSARPLAELYLELAAEDEPYGIYRNLEPSFLFYTEKFAEVLYTEGELRAFTMRGDRVWIVAKHEDLEKLDSPLPLVEVARDTDPQSRGYALLTPKPFQPPAD